jgi:hypothetical protein
MPPDDPLLRFLLKTHRLSNEQYRGIATIQRESSRDLEDLLVNGRYLEAEELGVFIERQILDDLVRVAAWPSGSYRFEPSKRWASLPLARLSVEAALIEVARRTDERKRFAELAGDPHRLLGVRDLPDSDAHLSEEECELFGLVDGRHTVAEIVEAAPLSEYEACEALQRMLEANWIEFVGRRDPGVRAAPAAEPEAVAEKGVGGYQRTVLVRPSFTRELMVAAVTAVFAAALFWGARALRPAAAAPGDGGAFAAAQLRDLRFALDLYARERGRYPDRLEDLIADRWTTRDCTRFPGHSLSYRPSQSREYYILELTGPR